MSEAREKQEEELRKLEQLLQNLNGKGGGGGGGGGGADNPSGDKSIIGMRLRAEAKVRREKVFARASALHLPRLRRLSSYVCFEALFAAGVRAASEGLVS